ncbi:MAG: hypothetical protein COA78_34810 [Blastopirellula sp.]|nr:MAG: hypothetical protein COA78_34810 [Blastopirellula sp.]
MKNYTEKQFNRRDVLTSTIVGATALSFGLLPTRAQAASKISVTKRKKCATCAFWGGNRNISSDRKWVIASGKGTCKNPKSPVFNRKTSPNQGAPTWTKWSKLG